MKNVAKRLLEAIEGSNLSYADLAKQTKISKSSIQRYATGETKKIPIDAVKLIASATGVSAAWIMGWTSEEEKENPATANGSEISEAKQKLIDKVMQMSDEELEKLNLLLQVVEAK